ncbi:MAG: hypothetical protein C4B58_14175 [Deltaproteobacteria bacterium]|nr:MAG: hypothetical protein C4B58_14175 [Deltaproteobacteria bacterium]
MSENNCKTRERLPKDLGRRLASYSTMAAGISLAFAPHANAAAKCNILETPLTVNTGSGNVNIDIDGDETNDFRFFVDDSTTTCRTVKIERLSGYAGFDNQDDHIWAAKKLAINDIVSADGDRTWVGLMATSSIVWTDTAAFNNDEEGYIGVKFKAGGTTLCNGWVLFKGGTGMGEDISGEIKGWGYKDTGATSYAGENCTGPTLVELASFTAASLDDSVQLAWETASEIDCAGFHILRSKSEGGIFTRITESLIPSKGEASQGAAYSYRDSDVDFGQTYYYRLKDIDYDGQSTIHEAVSITVEHGILLMSPEDGVPVPVYPPPAFEWNGADLVRFKLGFSRSPDFTGKVVVLPRGSKRHGRWITGESYTPSWREWRMIRHLGRRGGTVYWAVSGEDEAGKGFVSKTFQLNIEY